MAAIGGFRSDLSNVSAGVLFSKVTVVTLSGCRVSRDRQACFVNWFCSSYLHISTEKKRF